MAVFRCGLALLACPSLLLAPVMISVLGTRAHADPAACRVISLDFTTGGIPAGERVLPGGVPGTAPVASPEITPQMVAWIEKPGGEFVDTIYITQQTGHYGIGNRPGRYDFNSGPRWPYGRRITVFPVWSNKQPIRFPQVGYRDSADSHLSHQFDQSSPETHFCRPLQTSDTLWDAVTCSSTVYTDKGVFGAAMTGYPPRADITTPSGMDSPSVNMYRVMNPFDAISQATPRLGEHAQVSWPIPASLPPGEYVLFMEVALEQDFNATYTPATAPPPPTADLDYPGFGVPYRGQPSVIYRVAFSIKNDSETVAIAEAYSGYGDPGPQADAQGHVPAYAGPDGQIRPPDATISTNIPNSGALRLLLTPGDNGKMYRLRVDARSEEDFVAPGMPGDMVVTDPESSKATLSFLAPGDDGTIGTVRGYEVRYLVGQGPITSDNFDAANEVKFDGDIVSAGQLQSLTIKNLLPDTDYTVAVRAYDDCHNTSAMASTSFTTAPRKIGEVDACFVATAAYGSVLANDVEMLRRFRDMFLRHSVLGELAVETYYTFGPPVAGVVGESDLLRSTAREILTPLVTRVRALGW
jgi:hypothetical protein